ncbi:MAG: glycosyltransferase family 4 protein [Bacteroidales bacterium]
MKIIILFDSFSLGGAEFHAFKLAKYFSKIKKYETTILVFKEGDGAIKKLCDKEGINTRVIGEFTRIRRFMFPLQIRKYRKIFNEFKPDVILSFNLLPNLLNGFIWKHTTAKFGIWSQQNVSPIILRGQIEKNAIKNISCFIANSFHGAEFLVSNLSVEKEKVFVVQNGIEEGATEFSVEEWKKKLGLKGDEFIGIMPANLTGTKDHITLLKSWKIVSEKLIAENKKAILLLPGRLGETTDSIMDQIRDTDLFPYIKILGMISDMPGLYRVADISILSSNAEGLPNAVLESMEAGLPVAGTRVAGIMECVGEEGCQFLHDPYDFEKLAENILRFSADSKLCDKVGIYNHERVRKYFAYEKMCEETLAVISKCYGHSK